MLIWWGIYDSCWIIFFNRMVCFLTVCLPYLMFYFIMNPFPLYDQSSIIRNHEEKSLCQSAYREDRLCSPLILTYHLCQLFICCFPDPFPSFKLCSKLMELVSSEFYFSGVLGSWLLLNFGNRRHWKKISRKKKRNVSVSTTSSTAISWQWP